MLFSLRLIFFNFIFSLLLFAHAADDIFKGLGALKILERLDKQYQAIPEHEVGDDIRTFVLTGRYEKRGAGFTKLDETKIATEDEARIMFRGIMRTLLASSGAPDEKLKPYLSLLKTLKPATPVYTHALIATAVAHLTLQAQAVDPTKMKPPSEISGSSFLTLCTTLKKREAFIHAMADVDLPLSFDLSQKEDRDILPVVLQDAQARHETRSLSLRNVEYDHFQTLFPYASSIHALIFENVDNGFLSALGGEQWETDSKIAPFSALKKLHLSAFSFRGAIQIGDSAQAIEDMCTQGKVEDLKLKNYPLDTITDDDVIDAILRSAKKLTFQKGSLKGRWRFLATSPVFETLESLEIGDYQTSADAPTEKDCESLTQHAKNAKNLKSLKLESLDSDAFSSLISTMTMSGSKPAEFPQLESLDVRRSTIILSATFENASPKILNKLKAFKLRLMSGSDGFEASVKKLKDLTQDMPLLEDLYIDIPYHETLDDYSNNFFTHLKNGSFPKLKALRLNISNSTSNSAVMEKAYVDFKNSLELFAKNPGNLENIEILDLRDTFDFSDAERKDAAINSHYTKDTIKSLFKSSPLKNLKILL